MRFHQDANSLNKDFKYKYYLNNYTCTSDLYIQNNKCKKNNTV